MAVEDRTKRLFFVLWAMGTVGVLSLLLLDIDAIVAMVRLPEEQLRGMPPWYVLKLASVLQPAILTTVAVLTGMWLAPKVGLHAPASEAFAEKRDVFAALRPQMVPGIVAGILCGVAIAGSWVLFRPFVTEEFAARSEGFNKAVPAAVRFFYGGLTEEVLLRWGMMTFLVFVVWRLFAKAMVRPPAWVFVAGIFASALLFGVGHLPIASLLAGGLTFPLSVYVIAANALFGIAGGFLYWNRGLESAMIAHVFAHIVLLAAVKLAL